MKTNKNKNVMFSSDFNFSRTSRIIIESEDLDVAPFPPAHLFLSRDQVRLLEENVRNQIPLKSKASLESKATHLYSSSQESLIQNQHSVRMDIFAQAQDSFPGQSDTQYQSFSEAQFTSQARESVNNQESISSHADVKARYFALPQELMKKPLSSSTHASFQTKDMVRNQPSVEVPHSVETKDSIEGLDSDKKHLDEAQYSVWFEDSNEIKYLIQLENTIFKNARFLVLTLNPKSVVKGLPQLKSVRTKGRKQIASSKLKRYHAYGSVPLAPTLNRQKKRRKSLHCKSKFRLRVPPQKSKETPTSRVFQITGISCHTSECSKLRHRYVKKKALHQRKSIPGIVLRLIYVFKFVPPYSRKYSQKRLVRSMPDLIGCGRFLLKQQHKSPHAEQVSHAGSTKKGGTSESTKNTEAHGRETTGLKSISPKIPPQPEPSLMASTYQRKTPRSPLIKTTWKDKESRKDPVTQAQKMDPAASCVPNSGNTADLHVAKHETPLEASIPEPLWKVVSSPHMDLGKKMETWEDLQSTENSYLPLSNGGGLATSTSERQRCFRKGNTQEQKDFLELVLESSDVSLLVSPGTKKHKSSEQSAGIKIQESTEDVSEKEKKPLMLSVTGCVDRRKGEELERDTRSNIKKMQDKRIPNAFHDATHTAISEPPPVDVHSRFKTKADSSEIGLSHSVVKQDELRDDKMIQSVEYVEKGYMFEKPQEHDKEEEQQALQEAVPQLAHGFRSTLQPTQKPKYVNLEIGQSSSESRRSHNQELEVQPQTLSTETIVGTRPSYTVAPCQVEKLQPRADRPTEGETAEPAHPLPVSASLPVLTETAERGVPFGRSPRKTLDEQIAEEKEALKRVLPEVALESFHRHMLPLSGFKRKRIRNKLSGTISLLGPESVIMKVKKPPILRRRRLKGSFKILMKQRLQDQIVAERLVNVIEPRLSVLPHVRTQSRLNADDHGLSKLKQEKAEVKREECSDTINKGSDSGNAPKAAKLQHEMEGDKKASPDAFLQDSWNLRLDAYPEKELKTKKEMQQPSTVAEVMVEPIHYTIVDPFHTANVKTSLTTQTGTRCTTDSEMPPSASEKSLTRDPLNQTRGRDVPDYGSDTSEMGYYFPETKAELAAIVRETLNCHMPALSHFKKKKNRVRFSFLGCTVKPQSVHMKEPKPSLSRMCNISRHRKKLESSFKGKFKKINQANGLVYEYLNTLYCPLQNRLQGESDSCYNEVQLHGLTDVGRPRYVDFFDRSSEFCGREENVQDGDKEEQKPLLRTAAQPSQYLWINACQGKETHFTEPVSTPDHLTQEPPIHEQDRQHQTCFPQMALQAGLQMCPRETKELLKTSRLEDGIIASMGLEILPPETGNTSLEKPLNTTPERGLPSGGNLEREPEAYLVGKNSELAPNLQVTFLQSSDSAEPLVSKSKRKKITLKLARKQKTMSGRHRTMREQKPSSILHVLDGLQNKELQCNLKAKMKSLQQNESTAAAFLDIIHFKVPRLNVEREMLRITRPSLMQLMQEKSPNGREVCRPDSLDTSSLCNHVKYEKEEPGEQEDFPAPENSQGFIFNVYQKKDHAFVKSDEEPEEAGSIDMQAQPPTHCTQTLLSSAPCPALAQFQFGKLDSSARFSPPMSGEANFDEKVFSARECGVPSGVNHQEEQASDIEKKERVTSDLCSAALSVSKSKRNFKHHANRKIFMNPKHGILKAKKPSISYMLNIKGGAGPNHRKELGCDWTTKMKEEDQGEKTEDGMYSLLNFIPDAHRYSKREREMDMLGEKRLSSEQVKQEISPEEGTVTSDDTEESNLEDEDEDESEQEMLLNVIPQHSQHFIFCSGQAEELTLHTSKNKGRGKILFVIEQGIPPQTQPADPVQPGEPKRSHQSQTGTTRTASSDFPLLTSKESRTGRVSTDTGRPSVPRRGSHTGEQYHPRQSHEGKAAVPKDLQATLLEPLDVSAPDLSGSKRQRKTFTCRAFKSKMSPRGVAMKARKAPISQIFNIPGNSCLKTLPPKTRKSQIVYFLIHAKYSGVLDDLTLERKEGLTHESPAGVIPTLVSSVSKRKKKDLKLTDKRNRMSHTRTPWKAKKAPISQMSDVTKHGVPRYSRQIEHHCKTMMKRGQPVAGIIPNVISSPTSGNVETGMPCKTTFSRELLQQEQASGGERTWCDGSTGEEGRASSLRKEIRGHSGEAGPRNSQQVTVHAHKMKEPRLVKSDLERKYSAKGKPPELLTIAQELQQYALFTRGVAPSASGSTLNSPPLEKLPKRTKTQKGLQDAGSASVLSPVAEKSLRGSFIAVAQSDVPSGRGPGKKLSSAVPEGKIRLGEDLQARPLQSFGFSMPASSEIKGLRSAARTPKSRIGQAQMAVIFKTTSTTRSGAPPRGKKQIYILGDTAKGLSQSMPGTFANTFFPPTPGPPALRTHKKLKAKKCPLRKKSSIIELKRNEGKKLCTHSSSKWSTSRNTSESRRQNETEGNEVRIKARLKFLPRTGSRKDQTMLVTEEQVQQHTLVSENILESPCSFLKIPFPTEKLRIIPPQTEVLPRPSEKISCPKRGKAMSGGLAVAGAEYSPASDGAPARKLDVPGAGSLKREEKEENTDTQKVIKYPRSEISVLEDPDDESSSRNVDGHFAKKHKELQRDLLALSMTSFLSESERQEKAFTFPERKDLKGAECRTMKAKKPLCSQVLNSTKHGNLCCRNGQEGKLKPMIKDMQHGKSMTEAFSSPTPVSTDNKLDIETNGTPKPRMDPPRGKMHSHTSAQLEKPPCDGGAWEADLMVTQSRSSNTGNTHVPCEKKEKNTPDTLAESVPQRSQCFHFSSHHMKNLDPCKSESKMHSSEARGTWNLSCAMQKKRQEKHVRETILEPLSRNVMNFIQVQTLKTSLHNQGGIQYIVDPKTPLPKAQKSETGSTQCGDPWDGKPGRKRESPISKEKARNQNDFVRKAKILIPKADKSLIEMRYLNVRECSGSLQPREDTAPRGQKKQQEPCVPGTSQDSAYAYALKYPKIIKHSAKAETASMKNTTYTEQVKSKAKKPPVSLTCNTIGYGSQSNKEDMSRYIQKQKGFRQAQAEAELVLNTICDCGLIPSKIRELMERKREKGKPPKLVHSPPPPTLEKSLSQRQMAFSQSMRKSAISRNSKTLRRYVGEQKENQVASAALLPQCRYRFVISQQLKKETDHVKFTVDLKREVYPDVLSQKRETSGAMSDISNIRMHTKHEFLTAQRAKKGDEAIVQGSVSAPKGREVFEKTDMSLSSEGQTVLIPELAASQLKICKKQELLKQGSISYLEPSTFPLAETPHPENTGKVPEDDAYTERKSVSHLLRREGLKETDILQGSKGQTFLCTNVEVQQNVSAAQKDSVSCPSGEPLLVKQTVDATRKKNVSIPFVSNANPWRKEKSKLMDILSKSNEQKINLLQKVRAKQQRSSNQKAESILKSISSCILHQLHIETLQEEGSAKGMSSTVLSPVVEEASSKADNPVDQPPCSEGVNLRIGGRREHPQESMCKALPTPVSDSLTATLQIKLPRVKKAVKEVGDLTYHTPNTEGLGLPVVGKEGGQPECTQHICPNLTSHPSRTVFQSNTPYEKKALEKGVSTVAYTPSAEGIGSPVTRQGEQQEKCTFEALLKSAFHSQACLLPVPTPVQREKLDDLRMMHFEYSTPQTKEALKGKDLIVGYSQKSEKRQSLPSIEHKQQHLWIPSEYFLEHTSYPQNDPWPPSHLTPPTKEALSEMGNVSSETRGWLKQDLISEDQLNTRCQYGLEWTVPLIPPRQRKNQNLRLPLESFRISTVKNQNVSVLKGKKSSGGEQIIDSISNGISPKLRVRKKMRLWKAYQKRVQKQVYLPGLFLHSLPIYMPLWPGSKRRKNKVEQGVKKGITCPQRTLMLEKSVFSNTFDTADYSTPGNRPEHQWNIKEKMAYVEHRKVKPDLVVTNIYEFIPCLPHLKLNKKTIDERFSNNVKRTKQPISQKNDRLKGINMKGRMEPSIILKAEQSSLSPIPSEMELPILLNVKKQEIKVQKGEGKAGMKLTNVPSLAHSNLSSRIKLAKDESGIPRSCLPPLKAQASSNLRRASFAESINRESLSNVIDAEHLPQKKEEDGDSIVYMKALRGYKSATLKRKKKLFKHTPHGKEPQWKNKEQEKMMQEDKSDLDVVRNKPHVCIPSSPHLEQRGPGLREEAGVQGITGFCLPPLTLRELSDAMTVCQEPTDAILHSIKRAKYRLWKNEDEMARALEERRPPQKRALGANQSPVTQALQLNIKEKEEKVQEDKDERVGIQRKSRDSTSSPPSSEVDPRRKREAVMLRSTRSPFLHPEPQEPSDPGKVARQKSVDGVEKAKEHITQEEEKRGKMAKVMPLRRKKSPDSQEIQLDIKENKEKTQRMKGEPNVVLTCTSIPATSVKLDKSIKKADYRADTTRCSLPELLHQKLPAVVKKANKESTEGVITSAVQEAEKHVPQKEEGRGKAVNTNSLIHPKGTPSKAKISLHPREPSTPGTRDLQVREVQTNRRKNLAEVQERKVLTAPCLRQFPVNKDTEGKQEGQGIIRLHLPPSWPRESSHAEKFTHPVSPVNYISRNSRGTKYGRQKEEDKANIFMEDLMHPKCLALKAKKSPLFQILKAKKLQVSIREQMKRGQEGSKDTVVLLSKICPFATSSTHLKFDTIKEEEGEPGILRNLVPPPEPQDPLLSVQTAPPKWTDSHRKKGERYPPWKEKDGVQTAALSVSLCPSGRDFKAKTPTPPGVLSDAEHGALSRRKEAESCTEGRGGQGLGRAEGADVAPTKTPPSSPSPSHRKWDAGAKGDKDLLITAGSSRSPFQLPESSGARSIRCTDSSHGISSCNVIIHANRLVPYKEAMVGVKAKDGNDRLYPRVVTLEAHTSPLSHPHSRKRPPLDVREQGKGAQKGRGEPKAALREPCASLPPSSRLKWDPSRRGKEDTGGITRSCFPPLKIHDPFTPSTKADPKSCDGFMLKEERLKTATQEKMPPVPVHQKAKEFPLSYLLDTKELQGEIREPKKKVQREDGDLVAKLKNICTSLLTLQYCQPDSPGERYMIRMTKVPLAQEQSKQSSPAVKTGDAKTPDGELATEVKQSKEHILQRGETDRERNVDTCSRPDPHYLDLKAKESPLLLTQNLRDLQQKTKEQEGKVQEGKWQPKDVTLAETCMSASFPPRPNEKSSVREEGTQTFPPVNAQKSLGSEEELHADPTASSPQKETRLPPNEEEGGTERRNFKSSKRAENEKQESKDEPGRVLTRWAPSSPSPLPFQSDKEVQVGGDVPAVHKRSVQLRRSNAGEIIARTESVSGNITRAVQTQTTSSSLSPLTLRLEKEVQVGDDVLATHERSILPRRSNAGEVAYTESVSGNLRRDVQTQTTSSSLSPLPFQSDKEVQVGDDMLGVHKRSVQPRRSNAGETIARTESVSGNITRAVQTQTTSSSLSPLPLRLDKEVQVGGDMPAVHKRSVLPRRSNAGEVAYTESVSGNLRRDVQTQTTSSSLSPLPFQSDKEVQVGDNMLGVHKRSVQPRRSNAGEIIARTESVSGNITRAVQTLTTSSSLSPFTFKSDKEVQVGGDMPAMHERSVLPRLSTAVVHTESVSSDVVRHVQTKEQRAPGKAERDRASAADPRCATQTKDRTLGSRKPAPSHTLHRTELYLHVAGGGPKAPEGPGEPPCLAVRKIHVSQPPAKPKLDKGTQVDEGRLGVKRPSLLPRMLSALSERKERAGTKGIGGNVIERKQHVSEKEKKDAVTKVDLRLKTYGREALASPISNILRTREFVLNVIKEPEEKRHKGPAGPGVVLTRTFLSIPSPPLYLDSGSKTDKEASGIRRSSCAQRNLQASADTRKTATRETAAGEGETVHTKPSVPEEVRQWTSNFMVSVQCRKDPPRVRSEGDLSRFLFNSQQEDFYFTGFGAIRSEKRLECFLTGPEDPQEKYRAEALTTFLSFPIMDLTTIENLKKETEIMTNLTQKISPPVLVSLPRKTPKDIHAPLGPPVSAEGCPAAEQGAHQRDTLSRASPGSAGACKFDRPEGDRQNNEKISTMSPPNVLDPQTKESLEEMNITRSNASPNTEQEIFLKKQVVLRSGSGQKTRLDSSLSLKIPLPNGKQRTPLEIDMHKQTTVYPGLQTLRGTDMGVTEFNALNGKKEQATIVPEQEACNLDLLRKSFSSCFTFPLQSGDLEKKTKTDTSPPIHFEQNKLEMKEGILKINTNIAVR
uniref:Coiled-coil domain containing 168 n=1 Tax=Sus scrofa TaxID=9823 RepID=A0A8D0YEE3_PIG